MPTKAKATKGTLLKRGDGGTPTEVFTTIAEVLSFAGPGETTEAIDVTSMDSTAREFISNALPDGGEVTFEVNFVGSDTGHQGLRTDLRNGTLRNFKVVLNDKTVEADRTTFTISGVVTGLEMVGGGVSEQYRANVTIKVSGLPTVAYAAA